MMRPDPAEAASAPAVGVLALQGDFAVHLRALQAAGAIAPREVRGPEDLEGLTGVVLPGGESTTMLRLLDRTGLEPPLQDLAERGGAILGTCAGIILCARQVTSPEQRSLGLLACSVARNAYGRQIHSFQADVGTVLGAEGEPGRAVLHGVSFIRAPRILEVQPPCRPVAWCGEEVVGVQQGRIIGLTFHVELTGDLRIHRAFLRAAEDAARSPG